MLESMAWGIVALIVVLAIAQTLVEWFGLRRMVSLARHPERLSGAVRLLGSPHRQIFGAFVESQQRNVPVDEALTRALVQGAQAPFSAPVVIHIVAVVLTAAAVLAPVVAGLLQAAATMATLFNEAQVESARVRYLKGGDGLHPAFEALGEAFEGTAAIVAALALAWAFRWWLLRPEVREARLIRALIQCAGRSAPGTAAPIGTRLAELIAPDRGLARPILATAMWTAAVTLAWLTLLSAAQFRTPKGPKPFDVWPTATGRRIEVLNVMLPRGAAGAPMQRSERPSLTFARHEVIFHNVPLFRLTADGALPTDWTKTLPSTIESLEDFPTPLEVVVLADRATRLDLVASVLEVLAKRFKVRRYHLIIERDLGVPNGKRQASLPLEIRVTDDAAAALILESRGVRLLPAGAFIPFTTENWSTDLRNLVRNQPHLWDPTTPIFALELTPEAIKNANYDLLITVMSAVDSACRQDIDCGLPGLGIRFAKAPR